MFGGVGADGRQPAWSAACSPIAGAGIFAMFARGKIDEEFKKRAKELAPEVMRETAKKVGPKLDEMIDEFAQKLDAWVVTAGEELHREVVEVLRATKDARDAGEGDEAEATASVEGQAAALAKVTERIEKLRAALWAPPERVRVAEAPQRAAIDHAAEEPADTVAGRASWSFSKRFMKRRQSLTTRGPAAPVRIA